MILSLAVIMFSFGGLELIGITAAEAQDPQKSIPKAVNQVVYRILLFYIGSLVVLLALYPWVEVKSNSSPFVMIFHNLDSNVVASALNFVILVASLSVYNSGVYSNSRMLFGLCPWERAEVLNPRQPSRRTSEFTDPLRCYYVSGRTDQLCPAAKGL